MPFVREQSGGTAANTQLVLLSADVMKTLAAYAHDENFATVKAISHNGGSFTFNNITCRLASNVGVVVTVSGIVIAKKVTTYTNGVVTSSESNVTVSSFTLTDSNNYVVKVYDF